MDKVWTYRVSDNVPNDEGVNLGLAILDVDSNNGGSELPLCWIDTERVDQLIEELAKFSSKTYRVE